MRKLAVLAVLALFACGCSPKKHHPSIQPYVNYLDSEHLSGVDYVMSLFDRYDIVVLCERDHAEVTQYDFITKLISDQRFIESVGNIFIEIGGAHLKPRFDSLFLGEISSDSVALSQKIMTLQRDASFWPLWNNYSYFYFLQSVCNVNRSLATDQKLRLFPLDIPFDWAEIKTREQYESSFRGSRDPVMAQNALRYYEEYLGGGSKVLIIQNDMHAFRNYHQVDTSFRNFMYYFEQGLGKPLANIFIHNFACDGEGESYVPIQSGMWDAAFAIAGKREIGFDLANSPFGDDNFDFVTDYDNPLGYKDVFTGMVYLPLEKCRYISGVPRIISVGFEDEIIRRHRIVGHSADIDTIRSWYDRLQEEGYLDQCPQFNEIVGAWFK